MGASLSFSVSGCAPCASRIAEPRTDKGASEVIVAASAIDAAFSIVPAINRR